MSQVEKNISNTLRISQDVIAKIITNAVEEIEGVYSIAPTKKTPSQIWFGAKNFGDIKIGLVDDVLSVSIGIILKSGVKATQTAESVQEKLKSTIQSMLGLTVAKVNVRICDLISVN